MYRLDIEAPLLLFNVQNRPTMHGLIIVTIECIHELLDTVNTTNRRLMLAEGNALESQRNIFTCFNVSEQNLHQKIVIILLQVPFIGVEGIKSRLNEYGIIIF